MAAEVAMEAIDARAGARLGRGDRYRLDRLLGTGGMASVWLAADTRLGRRVAVKVLSDVLALDDGYVSRFEREARIAANLSHPHLVDVFDFSVEHPRPYLVMEYIAGGSLADRLSDADGPALDPIALARELLDALAYIHDAGILHRDIKPANVLIATDDHIRLTDFGIAQPSDATQLTRTGIVLGTRRYIAPEIVQGHPATKQSDLYSCGVLIEQCRPGIGTPLHELAKRLTAEQPDQRSASADEAIAILDEPTVTAPRAPRAPEHPAPRRVYRTRREPPIHLGKAAAAALALVALVIAIIMIATSAGSPRSHASGPVRSPAGASLSQQLDRLDQAITQAQR
jgi:serine/threonine protein kinase